VQLYDGGAGTDPQLRSAQANITTLTAEVATLKAIPPPVVLPPGIPSPQALVTVINQLKALHTQRDALQTQEDALQAQEDVIDAQEAAILAKV
jgi:outer membrane protein TolC